MLCLGPPPPSSTHQEDDHWAQGLEHLDEGHREVEVGGVAHPEGDGVAAADGEDGADIGGLVDAGTVHPAEPHRSARHCGTEEHVAHREGDGEGEAAICQDILVQQDDCAQAGGEGGQHQQGNGGAR